MYTNQLAEEPPTHTDTICIGVALVGEDIQVAARATGREIAHGRFPAGPLGTAALLSYLTDWQTPMRLAVATAGAAALGLALAVGVPRGREVFLVSAQNISAVSDLARYAERAI
ncbi:MAG: hypothetical protein B7Y41_01175 [Hydrogenophilales bacterium 28-61-23]|nr:MAG: hypothetical protein B7Y41_01175 [Hydrogenophilales bacterium 28-61-23]